MDGLDNLRPRSPKATQASGVVWMTRDGRGDRIRTYDLFVPNEALYQAELHPDCIHAALE